MNWFIRNELIIIFVITGLLASLLAEKIVLSLLFIWSQF